MIENPNEYDDEAYTQASNALIGVVGSLWEAGAEADDIENIICDALKDSGAEVREVTIT